MRYFLVMVALCLLSVSCSSSKKDSEEIKIGKYLYIVEYGTYEHVIHCKRDCYNMYYRVKFIDTLEFASDGRASYCTRCFNDERYGQVQEMIKRNRKDNTMPGVSSKGEIK